MERTAAQPNDSPGAVEPKLLNGPTKPTRKHRAVKPQLLTRAVLDQRSNAAKLFDQLVVDIQNDLGGRHELSAIELTLVEAYAGAAITLENLNTRMLLGQDIDFGQHAQACTAMVRISSRLGLQRRSKPVPTLEQYLASLKSDRGATAEASK